MNKINHQQRPFDLQEWRRRMSARIMRRWFARSEANLCADAQLDGSQVRRVLVCRPNHRLGNLLLLTPLIEELGRLLPHARIDIVASGEDARQVFREFSNVQAVFCLSRRMVRHPLALLRTIRRLRGGHYDLAIDPCENSQSSRLLLVLARARINLGLPNPVGENGELRTRLLRQAPPHFAQLPVYLLRNALGAGARSDALPYPPLDIHLTPAEQATAHGSLTRIRAEAGHHGNICLGLFTGATGTKRYDTPWWLRFLAALRQARPRWTYVEIRAPGQTSGLEENLAHFASADVRKVAALISCLSAFVCADSGVMHLASASGTPTLGLFSATEPDKYAPYGHGSRAIETQMLSPEQVAAKVVQTLEISLEIGIVPEACPTIANAVA